MGQTDSKPGMTIKWRLLFGYFTCSPKLKLSKMRLHVVDSSSTILSDISLNMSVKFALKMTACLFWNGQCLYQCGKFTIKSAMRHILNFSKSLGSIYSKQSKKCLCKSFTDSAA